uniref:WD_REPEATS_REGION domain-containing protein n=1 Tax=Globodera pallida TaxID=36090 RepID=A0A183CBL8_GLOPA
MGEEYKQSSVESLFLCAQSANPHSVLVLDPFSGSSRWSLRGSELQQGTIQTAEPIGKNPSFLCVALADKPSLYTIPLLRVPKKSGIPSPFLHCPNVRSMLVQKARFIQTHPCGDFLFVGADNKLFTWELHSGQLLSLVEEHLRNISAMRISSCGHFLATASLDGDVKVFMTASLIAEREHGLSAAAPSALAAYSPHSLPVNDLCLSGGAHSAAALRILSVSADHSAALFSLPTQQILLRITADRSLTACCMDPAELRIFLAAESGLIGSVDICAQFNDQFVSFSDRKSSSSPAIPSSVRHFEHQHNATVHKLAVSADGGRMASGDEEGRYCVWDTANGQCLLGGIMQGPISALSFRLHWPTSDEQPKGNNIRQFAPVTLQRNLTIIRKLKMFSHWGEEINLTSKLSDEKVLVELLGALIKRINSGKRILPACLDDSNAYATEATGPKIGGKRRRVVTTEAPLTLKELLNNNTEGVCSDEGAGGERELVLAEQIRQLQRELARVVQLNAELYNYSANIALEDGYTDRSGRGCSS